MSSSFPRPCVDKTNLETHCEMHLQKYYQANAQNRRMRSTTLDAPEQNVHHLRSSISLTVCRKWNCAQPDSFIALQTSVVLFFFFF